MNNDLFWLDDIGILFRSNEDRKRYLEFFPTKKMSPKEVLNSLTRFFLYLIILFVLFLRKNSFYWFIPFIFIAIIIMMDKINYQKDMKEQKCFRPTKTNPFMNVLLYDYENNKDRKEGCSHDDPKIKEEVTKKFENNLFSNVEDIYSKRSSQHQFYTMPVSTIPNKQNEFAQWCYGSNPEDDCKTNQAACLRYEDVRYKQTNNFPEKKIDYN